MHCQIICSGKREITNNVEAIGYPWERKLTLAPASAHKQSLLLTKY